MADKCPECEEGLAEWIMSYADMITILMAFFVVMYSMAGTKNPAKEEAVLRSLRRHLGPFAGIMPRPFVPKNSKLAALASAAPAGRAPEDPSDQHQPLSRGTSPLVPAVPPSEPLATGGVVYFEGQSDQLSDDHRRVLKEAARLLAGKPQRIEIRGHASRRPLPAGSAYRDHWDLAYARCRRTMECLVAEGIEPFRIRLGVAAQASLVSTGQPLGISSDGRVEIFMLSEFTEQLGTRNAFDPTPTDPLPIENP